MKWRDKADIVLRKCVALITGRSWIASNSQSDTLVHKSRLYRDVHLDHHDAMYRAMAFIVRQGGPSSAGNTMEVLIVWRDQARGWLLAHEAPEDLFSAYENFVKTWSPVFPD